jgi:putative endonuclease
MSSQARLGHNDIGALGEKIASHYLKQRGYEIIDKNFKNDLGRRVGEIDLIAVKERVLIFVEVKTQRQKEGHVMLPEQQITRTKLHKLNKIAQLYIRKHGYWDCEYRFDAIAITIDPAQTIGKVRHIKNMFV